MGWEQQVPSRTGEHPLPLKGVGRSHQQHSFLRYRTELAIEKVHPDLEKSPSAPLTSHSQARHQGIAVNGLHPLR